MKFLFLIAIIFSLGITAAIFSAKAESTGALSDNFTVVELYTSQGCSSCPPADKILSGLAQNENLIVLGFHVSYWNHLNWKDILSREFSDIRQHGYADLFGSRKIYTPQMIINGEKELIGSRSDEVEQALGAGMNQKIEIISLEKKDNIINVSLPDLLKPNENRVWAFGYKKSLKQNIEGGENSGISVEYVNPVLFYANLGGWDGRAKQVSFELEDGSIDGIAILAQINGYGPVIAAGKLEF